jgi:hypothetical protein
MQPPPALHHRHRAHLAGLQLACPEMSTLSRDEAGLLNRATLTANEQRDAPGTRSFMPIGINMNQQLPDLTAGIRGSHLRRSEGHPRQALACIGRQGRPTGALDLILDARCGLRQGCCGPCWSWDGGHFRGGIRLRVLVKPPRQAVEGRFICWLALWSLIKAQ